MLFKLTLLLFFLVKVVDGILSEIRLEESLEETNTDSSSDISSQSNTKIF
jgi:hypothetical protein